MDIIEIENLASAADPGGLVTYVAVMAAFRKCCVGAHPRRRCGASSFFFRPGHSGRADAPAAGCACGKWPGAGAWSGLSC